MLRRCHALVGVAALMFVSAARGDGWWFEAEQEAPATPWILATSKAGYFGDGYLEWTGGDTRNTSSGLMAYRFEVTTPGTYIVNMRGRRDLEGVCEGAAGDECNDVYTRMNDGEAHKTMIKGTFGQWIWESRYFDDGDVSVQPATYDLQAGTNTFYLSGRSRGVKVDCFYIYREGTLPPTRPTGVAPHSRHRSRTSPNATPSCAAPVFTIKGRQISKKTAAAGVVVSTNGLFLHNPAAETGLTPGRN
jgi:hypothetical protein